MLGTRKVRIAIIGVAIAVALPLVYAGATTFSPKCSFQESYLPYSQENTEIWARISQVILVGTIKNVEVKLVEQVGDIDHGPTGRYAISKMPYKFVTVQVSEYLADRTGRHAEEVTFRTWANGCLDVFGNFSPMQGADYVTYRIGEKSVLTISDQLQDGMLTQGHYTYKFDISSKEGIEMVQRNDAAQIPEMRLSDLLSEIRSSIEKQNAGASQMLTESISVNIEKHGTRDFYQDQKVFLPTNFTLSDSTAFSKGTTIAWPSIGPNYIISESSSGTTVFDYYASLGIDGELNGIEYDEYVRTEEVPPSAISGRYFGLEWDQTANNGTRVGPGSYQVFLVMPVTVTEKEGSSALVMLRSESESFRILEGGASDLKHDLSLLLDVSKTDLETGEPFNFSLILVNNEDHAEYFSIDGGGMEFLSQEYPQPSAVHEPCYIAGANGITDYEQWHMSVYANYFAGRNPLHAGSSVATHDNTLMEAPKRPSTYQLDGSLMLTIADQEVEGRAELDSVRVSCYEVKVARPVTLNVTAPVYEGVSLVLNTDKEVYNRGETLSFELFLENNSDIPFKLSEIQPTIHIKDISGKQITDIYFIRDSHNLPTVQPHSTFNISASVPLTWDQRMYQGNEEYKTIEPGEYLIKATFIFPYLESEERTITISE